MRANTYTRPGESDSRVLVETGTLNDPTIDIAVVNDEDGEAAGISVTVEQAREIRASLDAAIAEIESRSGGASEPTDEQAEVLGREVCGGNWPVERSAATNAPADSTIAQFAAQIRSEQTQIGRAAWRLGARPSR